MTPLVVGSGRFARLVRDVVSPEAAEVGADDSPDLAGHEVVALVMEGWSGDRVMRWQTAAAHAGARLLLVRGFDHAVGVGPWFASGVDGCGLCAERRRRLWRHQLSSEVSLDVDPSSASASPALSAVAAEVARHVIAGELLGAREVFVLGSDAVGGVHSFVPLPECPGCSLLPVDTAERAAIRPGPRLQDDPRGFRVRPAGIPADHLRGTLEDWRFGPIGNVYRSEHSPLALVGAELALPSGDRGEAGYGRSSDYATSERIALLEAVERLMSSAPHGKRTAVFGPAGELDACLDLAAVGVHEEDAYDMPGFGFVRWAEDVPTEWVWGWRLGTRAPVLVPEHLAYWATPRSARRGARFLHETSNGCATGACIEEAMLYALFEVAERDAFLMTWYGQLPVDRLDVDTSPPADLRWLEAQVAPWGFALEFYAISNDLEIPAVLCRAVRSGDGPTAFYAAGAHADPLRAIRSAAAEVVTNVVIQMRSDRDYAKEMEVLRASVNRGFGAVRSLRDHILLHNLPEARYMGTFLDEVTSSIAVSDFHTGWEEEWVHRDLTQVLTTATERYLRAGLDPIVVDQSPPSAGRDALHTVKVIVPGSLTMTFGHRHRRVRGIDRLLRVPAERGFWEAPRELESLSLYPHPFP
ncbi:MAG: TOMM precursor leader peptide-binding protein [Dermatophilaceae bacterium]